MKGWKILLALSVAANLGFAYHMLDVGSAMTDAYSEQTYIRRDARACMSILNVGWKGRPKADALALPALLESTGVPRDDLFINDDPEDGVTVLGVTFQIVDNKVQRVTYYGNSVDYDPHLDPPQAERNRTTGR